MSIRAALALIIIATLCVCQSAIVGVGLYRGETPDTAIVRDLALIALSYFFSRQPQPPAK